MPRSSHQGLVLLCVGALGCRSMPDLAVRPDAPDVAIVVIDTLRADSAQKAETPTLDALAEGGLSVPYAWSPSTWTAPSTMSLMTGSHVREHGWDLPFPRFMAADGKSYPTIGNRTTLGEVMQAAGYVTVGLHANPLLGRELGWERGFDDWSLVADVGMARAFRRKVREASQDQPDRPLLAYLHLLGPHQPLRPSRAASKRWGVSAETRHLTKKGIRLEHVVGGPALYEDQYVRAYHATIEDTDLVVADFLQTLRGRERPLLLIVTSDHGELLGEHEIWGHDSSVWNPLTHVPLIISGDDLLPLPDVLTTAALPDYITRVVGMDTHWPVTIDDPPVLVSQRDGEVAISGDGHVRGIFAEGEGTPTAVYDVSTDPSEARPLDGLAPRAVVTMHHAHWEATTPHHSIAPADSALDAETRDLLEELGYMGGDE